MVARTRGANGRQYRRVLVYPTQWLQRILTVKVPKKADVAGHPKVSDHVGLLFNEPPGEPGCSLLSHPTNIIPVESGAAFTVNASLL